jgi:putative ABC transport system permease protein
MNDFTIVLRSLRIRLFSTLVTVFSVAVAVALVLMLLTMRNSGKRAFERGSGDMHLLVSGEASPLVAVLNGIFYANPPRRPLTWERFEQLQAQAPWAYAVPTAIGDSFMGYPVVATTREMFDKFRPAPGDSWSLREGGTFFNANFQIVVGADVARRTDLRVGDVLYLSHGYSRDNVLGLRERPGEHAHDDHGHDHGHDHAHDHDHDHADHGTEDAHAGHVHQEFGYTVVGVLKPTNTPHDRALFTTLESSWITHAHERRAREVANGKEITTTPADLLPEDRKITTAYLRLITREGSDTPANLPQVFDQLRRDGTLTVAQPKQEIDRLFVIVDNTNRLFLGIAILVMVSSGVGILLALYNSMDQRRRQIAVMRVLGASRGRIFGLLITECALIGLAGALAGVVLAFLGSSLAAGVLQDRLGIIVEPSLPILSLLVLVAGTIVLAIIAGLIPAILAYRTSVAENLKPAA